MTGRFGRLGVLTGAVTLGLVLAGCEDDHAAQRLTPVGLLLRMRYS